MTPIAGVSPSTEAGSASTADGSQGRRLGDAGALDARAVVPPGAWLGLLGGGQLGRMFVHAAQSMGWRVLVIDPDAGAPAGQAADRHLVAAYDDAAALDEMAATCAAATTEFENVPAESLERLAARIRVAPSARAVSVAQDRIAEKAFIRQALGPIGVDVAPYAAIRSAADLDTIDPALLPGILKVARLGYDGKGQARVATVDEARAAFESFGGVPCVLEKRLALAREVSVVVARGLDGATAPFPVAENVHVDGILATTRVPARVDPALAAQATEAARRIAQAVDYVGVLCVEFFVLADGQLVVNEMAPRPHNSGHWTMDGAATSQFTQQARALAGLPLGDGRALAPSVMLNLLGDCWFDANGVRREPDWAGTLAEPGAQLHLYGKRDARRGRKMGHVNVVLSAADGEPADAAMDVALRIARRLGAAHGTHG